MWATMEQAEPQGRKSMKMGPASCSVQRHWLAGHMGHISNHQTERSHPPAVENASLKAWWSMTPTIRLRIARDALASAVCRVGVCQATN